MNKDNKTSDTLIENLKKFGLNPREWNISTFKGAQQSFFILKNKTDAHFQMLGLHKNFDVQDLVVLPV